MRRSAREEGLRWLRQSERDLDDARFALGGQTYNLACFVAQQAAEKALKASLYAADAEEVWGHSVAELCDAAADVDADLAELASEAAPLDKFYIPTRYPNGLPGGIPADAFSRTDAESALEMAARVLTVVREKLDA